MLPIVLTADRGFWIEKPKTHSEDSDESEDDPNDDDSDSKVETGATDGADGTAATAGSDDTVANKRLGVHGYDPLHVPEMNGALIAFGPDLARSRSVGPVEQADVYALACRLLNMTCPTIEATRDQVLERFLRSDDDADDDDKDNSSNDSSEEEPSPAATGSAGSSAAGGSGVDDGDSASGKPARSRWANRSNGSDRHGLARMITCYSVVTSILSILVVPIQSSTLRIEF